MALLVIFCNTIICNKFYMFNYTSKFHNIAQYSNSHIFSMENDKNKI